MLAASGALFASGFLPMTWAEALDQGSQKPFRIKSAALADLLNTFDFEKAAQKKLPHMAYEYIAGGAGDEITMRWNREAFEAMRLLPRVLRDVEKIDTSTVLLGQKLDFPLLLAPTAFHRLVHPAGEVETARGADAAGVPFVVSSLTTRKLEDITRATRHPLWFQMFLLQKHWRGFISDLLPQLKANSCRAIVVTVDAPVTGPRNRSERAHFHLPDEFETPYYPDRVKHNQWGGLPISGSFTWDDVAWLKSKTDLPILLKGILHPADAKLAVDNGVSGIIVSNHGGRCLDTVPATFQVLPQIVDQVQGRIPILMDGGIRRGTDIVKAIASGANAVLIGRPYLFGLSVGGGNGVTRVVQILKKEFEMAMALCGRRSLTELDRTVLG